MRRHLILILIFLLAGAVANVAVAWGCVVIVAVKTQGPMGLRNLDVERVSDPDEIRWPIAVPSEWPDADELHRYKSFGWRWDSYHSLVSARAFGIVVVKAGWPVPALAYMRRLRGAPWDQRFNYRWRWWWDEIPLTNSGPWYRQSLPAHPLWPGFTVNTLFYAVILWMIVRGLLALRGAVRVRHGLCPACTYPIGESPSCTECGRGLPARATANCGARRVPAGALRPGEARFVKHQLLFILISLFAGAVVNVAVAWGCATWSPVESIPVANLPLQRYPAPDLHGLGVEFTFVPDHWYSPYYSMASGWPLRSLRQPCWHLFRGGFPHDEISEKVQRLRESLQYEIESKDRVQIQMRLRILELELSLSPAPVVTAPRRVFLTTPLWPGFAVNTLFYAAILWLLICGPFVLCRHLRQRRGLCPACAYRMGESDVCTECGRALPRRAEPAS